ncbi:MAG: hypothetical protein A3E01_19695 [Gammaproteobacteria bacterium RIFCSPHIGHO2_12_FULL_63_22]|nr:MAG: hypothetical protein A3E01_19695 [Gammaproteobacteria bacterium RIFCSPHIGHO2_12_FULL_63_22]
MSLVAELKRRKVFRVAAAYAVVGWLVIQVAATVAPQLNLPEWVPRLTTFLVLLGFPIAVVMAWVFDITPEGIKVDAASTGSKRVFAIATVLAALALGWYFRELPGKQAPTATVATAVAPTTPPVSARSIAVLPFVDMSQDKDQEYFSDGLSEQLLNALAQLPGLHVAGRTSSFHFKGRNEDLRVIGEKLNVATVLEGSVAKSGNTLRVTAQLINTADGFHLWSQTYDREFKDVFALQDEIANNVVAALKLKLLPGQAPAVQRSADTQAYDSYLLGRKLMGQDSMTGWHGAMAAFAEAVKRDPDYAAAYAELAESSYEVSYDYTDARQVVAAQAKALEYAQTAIRLDPALAAGYRARARIRVETAFDFPGALADIQRALELTPGDSAVQEQAGNIFSALGRFDDAQGALDRAVDLDPLSPRAISSLAQFFRVRGQLAQSQDLYVRAEQLAPGTSVGLSGLTQSLLLDGKLDKALATAQRLPDPPRRLFCEALVLHSLGRAPESDRALAELIRGHAAGWAYQVGVAYAWRGQRDLAFQWLDRAHAQQDGGLLLVKTDPLLANLHGDPRFTALLKKIGLPP